jgi:hypothetical protein
MFRQDQQQLMFRNTISQFYSSMSPQMSLNNIQLQEFNKQTLSHLLDEVRPRQTSENQLPIPSHQMQSAPMNALMPPQQMQPPTQQQMPQQMQQQMPQQMQHQPPSPPQTIETPEEKTQRIFQEKQRAYDMMTAKPDLPKPSDLFQEPNTDDGVIQNMDELISQYQNARDEGIPKYEPINSTELRVYTPPPELAEPEPQPQPEPLENAIQPSSLETTSLENTINTILDIVTRLETRLTNIENQLSGFEM